MTNRKWAGHLASGVGISLRSSEDEATPEGIVRIEPELVLAGDVRRAADFRNDGIVRAEPHALQGLYGHGAAENAFDRDLLVQGQLALGAMEGGAGAHARAGGRAV